jgi:polyisoprenoid-binding protein YceI
VNWDQEAPANSSIQLDLDVSSLRSGVTILDEALRGPDFFNFLNYPRIRFNSTGIFLSKWGGLTIEGNLEIMEISQPVSLTGEIIHIGPNPLTQQFTVGVSAQGELNRSEWEMTDYLPIIEDRIRISFEGEFILSGNPGNQNDARSRQGPSSNRPSPFERLPSQPGAIEEMPDSGSGTSTSPTEDDGFIFDQ